MAVVTVYAPSVKHPLVVDEFVTRTTDVDHDFISPVFLQRFTNASGDVVQNFIPTHPLPFPFSAPACPLERISDSFGIVDLIQRRRSFGAISPAAPWMLGIAFEPADFQGIFLYVA